MLKRYDLKSDHKRRDPFAISFLDSPHLLMLAIDFKTRY